MMKSVLAAAAAMLLAPVAAAATTFGAMPTPNAVNNLSEAPYSLMLDAAQRSNGFFVDFLADGPVGFDVSGTFNAFFDSPGGSFDDMASFSLGAQVFDLDSTTEESFAFFVGAGDTVRLDVIWADGQDTSKLAGLNFELTATPVPLPAAAWMLIAGIGGLAAVARRKARAAA